MMSDDYDSSLFKFVPLIYGFLSWVKSVPLMIRDHHDSSFFFLLFLLLIYGFLSWVVFRKSVPVMIRDHHDSSLFTCVVLIYGFLQWVSFHKCRSLL